MKLNQSLVNTYDEELYRSKAMCVWWMLRDMVGDPALKKALASYRPEQDTEPSYMQRLIQAQTQRDLGWFFDDWVNRDRGLPDFKVASAFSHQTITRQLHAHNHGGQPGNGGSRSSTHGEVYRRRIVKKL